MRVTGQGQSGQGIEKPADKAVDELGKAREAAPAVLGTAATAAPEALASSVLAGAKADLAALPEIDQAKVDALREALARGEIGFDAKRLATLIQRFHGSRG